MDAEGTGTEGKPDLPELVREGFPREGALMLGF